MRQAVRTFWHSILVFLLLPLAAAAQETKAEKTTQQLPSTGSQIFSDLVGAWWLWLGIIAILGLLGLLFYLRNKTDD